MIRYFLGRELAGRLGIPLGRWKRWAREFLPPDPLGGLQSGYARHYSIDQAFAVYLAGNLVSRSRFSIPEARSILSDLAPWLAAEGYQTGASEADSGESGDVPPVLEHLILIDPYPPDGGLASGFAYSIRAIISRRQRTRQGRQIQEEQYAAIGLGNGKVHEMDLQPLEQRMIWITRFLRHFVGCLELNPSLYAALRQSSNHL